MMKLDVETMRKEFLASDTKRDAGLSEPSELIINRNLEYGPYGVDNLLDVYYPRETTSKLPTIISIHGGGFCYGDKELYRFYTMFLATQGFTVVNFNYRLAPEHKYPAPLEDINRVMTWIKTNATQYFIDLDNLFIVGDSAGGQLAEQYLTIMTNKAYRAHFNFKVPELSIQATALNCGVYFTGQKEAIDTDFYYYFDNHTRQKAEQDFPVEDYITSDFPPAIVMTASHDFLRELALPLVNLLNTKRVDATYLFYEHQDGSELGHVFHLDQKSELAKSCNLAELAFFRKYIQ